MSTSSNGSEDTSKPPSQEQQALLEALKRLGVKSLSDGVAKQEGLTGSSIEPIHSRRRMRFYCLTETEIQTISMSNAWITVLVAVGSALFAFGLDIFKDGLLTENIPDGARMLTDYVQYICLVIGVLLWIGAGLIAWWRKKIIDTIKNESVVQ